MKNLLRFLSICLLVLSCNSDDDGSRFRNFCSVNNPTVDLVWLKTEIEQREQNIDTSSKYCYISQALYQGQAIIIYGDCNPEIDKVMFIYDCNGDIIGTLGDTSFPFEILKTHKIIWKTNDFVCEF